MNHYKYEEIEIGHEESFSVTLTEEMMDSFRKITGDVNPLHADDDFAREKGYDGKAAFGMLTASFLSTLAGVYLPGENSLIQNTEVKFMKPVYPGQTLTISGTVSEKNDAYHAMKLKIAIRNDKNEKVLRGTMQVGVLE